jgi:hypothetical protein
MLTKSWILAGFRPAPAAPAVCRPSLVVVILPAVATLPAFAQNTTTAHVGESFMVQRPQYRPRHPRPGLAPAVPPTLTTSAQYQAGTAAQLFNSCLHGRRDVEQTGLPLMTRAQEVTTL